MSDKQGKYEEYGRLVDRLTPPSDFAAGYFRAFWVGGLICCLGQALNLCWRQWMGLDEASGSMLTSIVLIFLGTTLTGLGVYDVIGNYAGAGSAVPITGFANSIAAPAIEFRREGLVMGVGAKLFQLAGPVLVYGVASSIVVGLIYLLLGGG
ncbi:MAG: stage V sporulation protein AC [Clostridiales bacterium]|nr:stage V sporulation protein AC [Clostridiales bacterium]